VSTFSSDIGPEEEDGGGWGGLLPEKSESDRDRVLLGAIRRPVIWSSGGGVQSTAIAVLILKGLLPRPDYCVMADTGREKQATWNYMDQIVNPALAKLRLHIDRVPCSLLERNTFPPSLFNGEGTLLIPAYEKRLPKLTNYCSTHWKRDVVKRWANDNGLTPAINWLGFSTDEMKRVVTPTALNWLLEYPLIFKCPRSREGCENEIEQFGWPTPPKSSCYHCPNMRNPQWRHQRDHAPEEFEQACRDDEEIRKIKPNVYLHESMVPLREADLGKDGDDAKQTTFGCNSGDCFV
jgi:hypothetical protein